MRMSPILKEINRIGGLVSLFLESGHGVTNEAGSFRQQNGFGRVGKIRDSTSLWSSPCSVPTITWAQDSPEFFRQNCMNCHTIGGGRLTGPDLKNVSQRKDREWLIGFMMNPKSSIDGGDPYALKIFEDSRKVPMPVLPGMTRERCENLLDLIDAESQLEESQFKGLQISDEPFTDADRDRGRKLFLGTSDWKRVARPAFPATACTI